MKILLMVCTIQTIPVLLAQWKSSKFLTRICINAHDKKNITYSLRTNGILKSLASLILTSPNLKPCMQKYIKIKYHEI